MAIILQDTGLENELMELSKKLHIKVDEEERDDISKNLSLISKEDNEIDTHASKIGTSIVNL